MFRYNQKTGDFSLTPGALATCVVCVFGFGGWMTKMQYDVSGWNEVAEKVAKIETVLIYNHLSSPGFGELQWPDPNLPASPSPHVYSSLPGAVTKRE